MARQDRIFGFLIGIVVDAKDPLGLGRAKVRVDGFFEPHHPEWCIPAGWFGAGAPERGARTSPVYGQQVALIFENGDPEASPLFFTMMPGLVGGLPVPATTREAYVTGLEASGIPAEGQATPQELNRDAAIEAVNGLSVLWEDENFTMFFASNPSATEKRFVLLSKDNRGYIVFNAADGAQGKSFGINIHGDTSVSISSKGVVDISGGTVQIQGRKVLKKPGVTSI